MTSAIEARDLKPKMIIRDVLTNLKQPVAAVSVFSLDSACADLFLAAWRRSGRVDIGDAQVFRDVYPDYAESIGDEAQREANRIRSIGREAWIAGVATKYRLTVDEVEARFLQSLQRWNRPDIALPDDWALVERLALAIVTDTGPTWIRETAA